MLSGQMFITFEGIDGSGKSTQARRLEEAFRREGYRPLLLREPGGTPLSEEIRSLLLDPEQEIVPLAELLLFSSARAQLVERRIRPALERGRPVICDRFYDSTTAYQGAGRNVADTAWIGELNRRVTGGLTPARTYYIELPVSVAAERMEAAGFSTDRMETSGDEFYERVANAYAEIARSEPERVVSVDGTLSPDEIHQRIWNDIRRHVLIEDGTRSS